jgi:NAD(P)H dehydrogenase (quinone)
VRYNRSQASTYVWSTPLRVFILYANPVAASFGATLRKQVVTTLRSRGHEIDDCDLYAEAFNPVMGEQERMRYHNADLNRAPIAAYADRLLAAEALVLIYPVWNERFPAILKGFFDRVFIPGVSFKISPDGAAIPNLQKLRKLAAAYGASRTTSFLRGDPPKRVVKRLVRSMPGHAVRCDYLRLLRYGSFQPRAAGRLPGEGQTNIRDPMRWWSRPAIWEHEVATTHSGGDHARRS